MSGLTLLAIETSTDTCSVALLHNGQIATRVIEGSKRHAEHVLCFVDELLQQQQVSRHELHAIAFGRGPGAFTGVRLSVAVTQGLAFALDIPTHAVSTLLACALDAITRYRLSDGTEFAVLLDARMGELYAVNVVVENGQPHAVDSECLLTIMDVDTRWPDLACAVGSGAVLHEQRLLARGCRVLPAQPTALAVAELARTAKPLPAHEAQPVYLRDNVAQTIAQRQQTALSKLATS
jgi:tRNA threonylcarbamoyladenosine biosynthesis protein TsaB